MSQMSYVIAAYVLGLGGIVAMLGLSFLSMRRAEQTAERLRAERRL